MTTDGYPDVEICSRCKDNTGFEQDPDTLEWLSVCCSAPAIDVDAYEDYDYDDFDTNLDDFDTQLNSDEPTPEDLDDDQG